MLKGFHKMAQRSRRSTGIASLETPTLKFLETSDSVDWSALRVRLTDVSADSDEFESPRLKDPSAHVFLSDQRHREVFVSGRWRPVEMERGTIATTPAGETWRLRYNTRKKVNKHRLIHLYVPQSTFESVVQQLPRSPGERSNENRKRLYERERWDRAPSESALYG
jgi:hypothetical protein